MTDLYGQWASIYDCFYPDRSAEVAFWSGVAGQRGPHLLDVMCGTAEVSLGLARSGYRVTGIDVSPAMLAVAARRLDTAADYPAKNLCLVRGDARAIATPAKAFDFALVGGSGSFNHLDRRGATDALGELGRVLRPGGGLGLELLNPGLLKEMYPARTFGPFRPTQPGLSVEKTSYNHYDRAKNLFQIRQVTRVSTDAQEIEFEESFALRVWQPEEVKAMVEAAGFHHVDFFGDHQMSAFNRWSPDLLVVATKACADHL